MSAVHWLVDPPREELHDGKRVMMAPPSPTINHGRAATNLTRIFSNYLADKPCEVWAGNIDVHLSDKDCFVPDLLVVCNKDIVKDGGIYGAPDLVVEILSPSTAARDRGYKKDLYEKHGVRELWLVYANKVEPQIEVYLLKGGAFVLDNVYAHYPGWMLERMTAEQKSEIITEFKTSVFDDLIISVDMVFKGII